jgi:uncharacterized protein (TIGR02466 family)
MSMPPAGLPASAPDCGVLYVASKQDTYVEEAFVSAASVKRHAPSLHITLFTDRTDNPLCRAGCFDRVEPFTSTTGFDSPRPEAQLDRLACLARTPYARTLYLDTDTRILTPAVATVFGLLDNAEIAMVEYVPEYSHARTHVGRRMFNAGVILYRRSDPVLQLFQRWAQRLRHNLALAAQTPLPCVPELSHIRDEDVRRALLRIEKIALMEILDPAKAPADVRAHVLDASWNFRAQRPRPGINILHAHERVGSIAAEILEVAHSWMKAGDVGRAGQLYDYVGTLEPAHLLRVYWPLALSGGPPGEEWASPALKQADLHIAYGQAAHAAEILKTVIDPRHRVAVLTGYARLSLAQGGVADALGLAAQARAAAPQSTYAAAVQAAACLTAGRDREAIPALIVAARERKAAHSMLGLAYMNTGQFRESAAAYEKAVTADPDDPAAANNLLPALLATHRYTAAIVHADKMLDRRPGLTAALAFKCVALAEVDRRRELDELIDFDRRLVCETLPAPAGFSDIATFNRALAREIATEPTLTYERNTTRFGFQTDDIGRSRAPAIQSLNTAIMAAARRRADQIATRAHPFEQGVPRAFRAFSWGVVLQENGHQAPHFHPNGWLSGVYYIEVPEDIREDDPEKRGWIEFGRGDDRWHRKATAMPARQIFPREGLLVTFPSYYWHNTRPLYSKRRRISFAFDIIPLG